MRNVDCPYYQACLDRAARNDFDGWSCAGCRCQLLKSPAKETDFSEYRLLLWAIFQPDLYEQYNDLRQAEGVVYRPGSAACDPPEKPGAHKV